MEFKDKIKQARLKAGKTLEDVGNDCNVAKATVQRWESGEIKNLRRDKILKLANSLHVTPAYLMGWEEEVNQLDQMLKTPKSNTNMQKRTLEQVETYFSNEMFQVLDTMKNFDADTQKELLKRAKELEVLEGFNK